jgi:Protein of unknown function (DUF3048) N-terminal domain/Protein of unknown function (DUF3048) C-terminal domain
MYSADYLSPPVKGSWLSRHSPRRVLVVGIALVGLVGLVTGGILYSKAKHKVAYSPKLETKLEIAAPKPEPVAPAPTTAPSPLTGLPIAPELVNNPTVAIMIENSLEARPQSGLVDAGVVFEAIAEAGITRFMAVYQDKLPGLAGPVRSARPYYVQWAKGFDAGFTHVGGSPDGLAEIASTGTPNLDDVGGANGPVYRIKDRFAPHNAYTDASRLTNYLKIIGKSKSAYTWAARKPDAPLPTPTASIITPNISRYAFNPVFNYDKTTNSYQRSQAGEKHIDRDTKSQLLPKVVVVLKMPVNLNEDGLHMVYGAIGSGEATIFQDGGVTIGKWTKLKISDNLQFFDSAGAEVKLNAGQVWVTVIGIDRAASYTP